MTFPTPLPPSLPSSLPSSFPSHYLFFSLSLLAPKPQQKSSIKFEPYATPSRPVGVSQITSHSPSLGRKELTDSHSSSSSVNASDLARDYPDETKPQPSLLVKLI